MAIRIPDRLTPIPLEEGLLALYSAYQAVMGTGPTPEALACLGAQLCLESGNFARAHCFNWGNKKMPTGWDGLCCQFRCSEIFDTPTMKQALAAGPCTVSLWKGGPNWLVWLTPPHPWSTFCAYASAQEGCEAYLRLLLEDRFQPAWHAALAGWVPEFVQALARARYFTADEVAYARGVESIYAHILPACRAITETQAPNGVDEALRQRVEDIVKLTLDEAARGVEPSPDVNS